MTTVALVGNPNSGKTTLFNVLTGARQRVGNWPGVTVEKKSGEYRHGAGAITVIDLPGTYTLDPVGDGIDERIARDVIVGGTESLDVLVNVIDAASLARGLYLTTELLERGRPVVIALNMMDVADRHGLHIDAFQLSRSLGCPVVPMVASEHDGVLPLKDAVENACAPEQVLPEFATPEERYHFIDALLRDCTKSTPIRHTLTDRIDAVVLHPLLAFPIFLGVMYLMFLFSINVGSAFIDFFDGVGNVLFIEGPRQLLNAVGVPAWLTVLFADGVGGGVQLVGTFIPVIGALFLALSFLEDSGYMGRVAFIVDRLLKRLGLPGKSFVPLIVGFGCNVPSVMATRTLDNQPDRVLTTVMAPYMSCGARLTVYTLFAAAFFPTNGQNVVFALYLVGIVVAVLSALLVRRYLVRSSQSSFVLELPAYHMPTLKNLLMHSWQRLKGFVLRAGKAIVTVVVVLNVVNSAGIDGTFGNEDSEKSVLSAIGRTLTPVFHPMGLTDENWPATVGIFTGVFAKEVVVGTLDALYSPAQTGPELSLTEQLEQAVASIPANLSALSGALTDPLGISVETTADLDEAAASQEVNVGTLGQMQQLFDGQLGAFAYLLFVLLYMPCVATIGAIVKEIGGYWATFSVVWSVTMAYAVAVVCYQLGNLTTDPAGALLWMGTVTLIAATAFRLLVRLGRRRAPPLIPLVQLD